MLDLEKITIRIIGGDSGLSCRPLSIIDVAGVAHQSSDNAKAWLQSIAF
jgi:hypothetical protein